MSNQQQRMVGVVGGTFDPIHDGHLRMALEVANRLALDEVRFIPSAKPPHRDEPDATDLQRLNMVELAIMGEARFILDDREYRREGDSYMVDTLESLRDEMGRDVSLILILGSDAFLGLTSWHRWQRLLELTHIAVVVRPGFEFNLLNLLIDQSMTWCLSRFNLFNLCISRCFSIRCNSHRCQGDH